MRKPKSDSNITNDVSDITKFNFNEKIAQSLKGIKLTQKQDALFKLVKDNEIISAIGPAGTSKTYMSIYCALHFLINNKNTRIFLTKPIVEAGENLGFLPGEAKDKIDPYLQSYIDLFHEIIGKELTKKLFEAGAICFEPVAYMRGRNLKDCFIIIDESQNYNMKQLMTLITRKHKTSKILLLGDYLQDDRFKNETNPFKLFNEFILRPIPEKVAEFEFDINDIVRDKLIIDIINNYEKFLNRKKV
jgi:phosphate starvation-inducible protein PhoH and related proteins